MRVHEVVLTVGDVDEGVRFYTEVLGLRLVRMVDHEGDSVAELEAEGLRLSLIPGTAPSVQLAFGADELTAARRELRRSDADCDAAPAVTAEGTWLGFRDPWGNPLGLWQDAETD